MSKNQGFQAIPGIDYKEVSVTRALYNHDFIDNWFPVRYSLNPYSGCEYGCRYCRVNWKRHKPKKTHKTVLSKVNLPEILSKELKKINSPQLIGVGGGHNDIFGPVNKKMKLSDQAITNLLKNGHKPLLMTKNPSYALEIVDEWLQFPEKNRPMIITSVSGSSNLNHFQNPGMESFRIEPGVPTLSERLSAMKKLSAHLTTGVAFLPWLVTENSKQELFNLMQNGKKCGWKFTLLGFLDGKIKDSILPSNSEMKNTEKIQKEYLSFSQELSLWPRIPPNEFLGYLYPKDELTTLLAYLYYLGDKKKKNTFRLASLGINCLSETEFHKLFLANQLEKIRGVGPITSQIIHDFLRYRKMNYFTDTWKKFNLN